MDENQKKVPMKATVKRPSIVQELGRYAMDEVIIPNSKEMVRNLFTSAINMFSDAATKTVDKAIYPDGDGPRRTNKNARPGEYTPRTNYTVYSRSNDKSNRETIHTRSSSDLNYIWVDTEDKARDLCNTLIEEIDNYGKAKVATLYENLTDEDGNKIPTTFSDFKFGWTQKDRNAIIHGYRYDRGQWLIDLPKPVNIENI